MAMTPVAFIKKWKASQLGEDKNGGGARQHFLDLCELLNVPKPADADPKGEWYCFEKGLSKTLSNTKGWADVWKKDHFAWEYKGPDADLDEAYAQLLGYSGPLGNPPLLVVSDTKRIIVRTNWNGYVTVTEEFELDELANPHKLERLSWVFTDPARLKPDITTDALTKKAAQKFADLAQTLRKRGHDAERVAHFTDRLAFCMFAEDVNLLPKGFFTERLYYLVTHPELAEKNLKTLFGAMSTGGNYGDLSIAWFNGGLFDNDDVLPLEPEDIALLHSAALMNWRDIDPSIFGTLFERGLDPNKRSQLGAHYTDAAKIEMIIGPVIRQPLLREWGQVLPQIEQEINRKTIGKASAKKSAAKAKAMRDDFVGRLREFRVLDPACGSGNFLYLALKCLKDIEHQVYVETEKYFGKPNLMETGPHNMLGIEINPYAAELARMSVWIGEIQWCLKHGWQIARDPILRSLKTIQCHDALLDGDKEFAWPKADVIIGNPPFLGGSRISAELGIEKYQEIRHVFENRLPGFSDLVCYWFEKSHNQLKQNKVQRVGLVATHSISGGKNREVLQLISKDSHIFKAWSDEPWTVEGASVRIAIICFTNPGSEPETVLNGKLTDKIYPDLTSNGLDLTTARKIKINQGISFLGTKKGGPFDLAAATARAYISAPINPNGLKNSNVIFRRVIGSDIVTRPKDRWVIDFGNGTSQANAAQFELPFEYVLKYVKPVRDLNKRELRKKNFWLHSETAPGLKEALKKCTRYIATSRISKHRLFIWLNQNISLDDGAVAIARDDDVTFGIAQSRIHTCWASRMGTSLGPTPRYTPSTTFETFPFPPGLEPNRKPAHYKNPQAQAIAKAAAYLNEKREAWLNPSDLVKRVPEVVEGYPDRIVPLNEDAEKILKDRTLTKLYNAKPQWLLDAHRALDEAVAAAYGWPADMTDDEILKRLLAMNLEASKK